MTEYFVSLCSPEADVMLFNTSEVYTLYRISKNNETMYKVVTIVGAIESKTHKIIITTQ